MSEPLTGEARAKEMLAKGPYEECPDCSAKLGFRVFSGPNHKAHVTETTIMRLVASPFRCVHIEGAFPKRIARLTS